MAIVKFLPQLVASRKTRKHSFLKEENGPEETRCKKSWDRFGEHDSLSPRYFKQVFRKRKDHLWEKQFHPYALKFEDRSHEVTERQQRCARSKAWNFGKNMYSFKEKDKAAFYFPTEERVLPAASTKEPEEREFAVDSAANMQMVSKRDLHSAELVTIRTSRSPTTVMTTKGEVQTREEATVFVKELDLFMTNMLLEETPAVLSVGKFCEDHWCTYHWTSSQKPHLTKNGKKIDCNVSNCVPFVVPGLSSSSSTAPTPTSSSSSSQDSVFDVGRYTENQVPERSEVRVQVQGTPMHKPKETENT